MSSPIRYPITFHVDQEHKGIRYSVLLILFVGFWLSFFLVRTILQARYPMLGSTAVLSCLSAIPLTLLLAGVSEKILKMTWHSGRRLVIDERTVRLHRPEQEDQVIRRDQPANDLWWYFPLAGYPRGGRERRIPAKWFCVAGQLQQENARIVVYCYAPPKDQAAWTQRYEFRRLQPGDVYNRSFGARLGAPVRPELTPEVVAGKDGKYWLGERNRWQVGVELTREDFNLLLQTVRIERGK